MQVYTFTTAHIPDAEISSGIGLQLSHELGVPHSTVARSASAGRQLCRMNKTHSSDPASVEAMCGSPRIRNRTDMHPSAWSRAERARIGGMLWLIAIASSLTEVRCRA